MTQRYRLIHFMPDPVSAARLPIAALLEQEGRVRVAFADAQPRPEDLADPRSAALLRLVREKLFEADSLETRPPSLGPHVWVDDPHVVPAGIDEAVGWLTAHVLPTRLAAGVSPGVRQPRAAAGSRFFETWHVDRWIHRAFNPQAHGQQWFKSPALKLRRVTHWVAGRERLLLLEPVMPARDRFQHDLDEVATTFAAYRFALERANGASQNVSLIAYVLAGATEDRRRRALEALGQVAHEVVDTQERGQRERLVSRVRDLGLEGELPVGT